MTDMSDWSDKKKKEFLTICGIPNGEIIPDELNISQRKIYIHFIGKNIDLNDDKEKEFRMILRRIAAGEPFAKVVGKTTSFTVRKVIEDILDEQFEE